MAAKLEDQGFTVLATAKNSEKLDELRLLGDMGGFGLNMFVIGLGTFLFSKHEAAGRDLVKLGTVLGVVGYGFTYALAETK